MFPPHAVFLGVLGASGLSKLSQVSKSLQGAEHWVEDGVGWELPWTQAGGVLNSGSLSDLGEI